MQQSLSDCIQLVALFLEGDYTDIQHSLHRCAFHRPPRLLYALDDASSAEDDMACQGALLSMEWNRAFAVNSMELRSRVMRHGRSVQAT